MNTQFSKRLKNLILVTCVVALTTACASKSKKQAAEASDGSQTTADITRPPTLIESQRERQSETNPDETVSYDDWRKRRQQEVDAAKQSTGDENVDAEESSPE